ncbi:MAG: EthD family reductase [Alphaproteobacteria bacterium]|nr:MAG: EthD family reductase [Alphaproteobacteria bacterium]
MFKVMSLMKRRPDLSFADFRNWAEAKHPLLAQKLPRLRGYRMNVAKEESPDNPYDAVSEMWFDSAEARLAAMATDAGKAAGGDAASHCASRFHFLVEEKVFV